MSNARIIQGRGLVAGTVEGTALVSQEPVSFLGDVDIVSGAIMGELPSMKGKKLGGSILVFPGSMGSAGRGGSSTSSTSTARIRWRWWRRRCPIRRWCRGRSWRAYR